MLPTLLQGALCAVHNKRHLQEPLQQGTRKESCTTLAFVDPLCGIPALAGSLAGNCFVCLCVSQRAGMAAGVTALRRHALIQLRS